VKSNYQPLSGNEMPRFGGPATFMRLPAKGVCDELDVGFVGVPFDIGTSNRLRARLLQREILDESIMLRPFNVSTGANSFNSLSIADIGDAPINTFNIQKVWELSNHSTMKCIIPLTTGGDHTIALPI